MKHATPSTLATLEPLLRQLRALHGLFADAKLAGGRGFQRLPVDTAAQWQGLLAAVGRVLAA
ncbi:MAG: hypothetical protein QM788_07635 [Roseateles sp.]|uniref:hypothetical protein n=1 Tax=Roseateles sp. TaxID=1971397 RepID=UPI0039EA3B5B